MNKVNLIAVLAAFLLLAPSVAAQPANITAQGSNPGIMPGSPLYAVESFVENLEVKIAGAIGGPDLKAKALANNADERLSEARALAARNQSEKAVQAVNAYEETMNRSLQAAGERNSSELAEKLGNVTRNNVKVLEDVKKRVPPEAQEGISRAIERSNRSAFGGPPSDVPGARGGEPGGRPENLTPGPQGEKPGVPPAENRTVPGKGGPEGNISGTGPAKNLSPGNPSEAGKVTREDGNLTRGSARESRPADNFTENNTSAQDLGGATGGAQNSSSGQDTATGTEKGETRENGGEDPGSGGTGTENPDDSGEDLTGSALP